MTQVDLQATSRLARLKPPGRVAQWLGAEPTTEDPELTGRIEPPSEEVRKEMLRLELAAIDAELETAATLAEAQRNLPPEGELIDVGTNGSDSTAADSTAADSTTADSTGTESKSAGTKDAPA